VANDTTTLSFANGTETTFINNIHVNFALSYSGVQLLGLGGKVRGYIVKQGEIIGLIADFWEVESIERLPILKPALA